MRKFDFIEKAVKNLYPQVLGIVYDRDTDEVTETNPAADVDQTAIRAEVARLETEYATNIYQRQRAAEYPPITDYIDGVVKGDQTQIDAYITACQAVKAKYPKP